MSDFFKIEFFWDKRKQKQKLYETQKSFDMYWKFHEKWNSNWPEYQGLIAYKNGKEIKRAGVTPNKKGKP